MPETMTSPDRIEAMTTEDLRNVEDDANATLEYEYERLRARVSRRFFHDLSNTHKITEFCRKMGVTYDGDDPMHNPWKAFWRNWVGDRHSSQNFQVWYDTNR